MDHEANKMLTDMGSKKINNLIQGELWAFVGVTG